MKEKSDPKFELDSYRKFIREASPYVSVVLGRKITPGDADRLTDDEVRKIAYLIDDRAKALSKSNKG